MHIAIRSASSIRTTDSLVLLLDDKGSLPEKIFSKEENQYVKNELKQGQKSIVINQYKRVVFIHQPDFSKKEDVLLELCRKAGNSFLPVINKEKIKRIILADLSGNPELVLAMAEGMALGNYQFLNYRSKSKKQESNALQEIAIKSKKLKSSAIHNLQCVVNAVYEARNMVNEPQNTLTATRLSKEFVRLGKQGKFKVRVFTKAAIKSMKMGGLLAVNMGSVEPPTFTVMEYKPKKAKNKKPYVLVGKGVVYDTGGLSLKPTANAMDFMKSDMAGAAAVGAAIYAIAKAKLPVHVIALVPATDNRPADNAYAPGDVIRMMSGHTVEVLNTDAEGRLILADALHYAKKYKPELVMDFATLTGAAAAAIGPFGMVCMGTASESVKEKMKISGNRTYERLAEFPIWDEYNDLLSSDIADMKNIGGPVAGAITAGKFLQRYTDYPWMHFDIAGPAFLQSPNSYRGKNASGVAVRFLFDYFSNC